MQKILNPILPSTRKPTIAYFPYKAHRTEPVFGCTTLPALAGLGVLVSFFPLPCWTVTGLGNRDPNISPLSMKQLPGGGQVGGRGEAGVDIGIKVEGRIR